MDQGVDVAAAYVRVTEKKTMKNLGTFLLSQIAYQNEQIDTVAGMQIGLRFKADYKPYSLTLKDVQAKMYPGTNTARWYSSEFILDDKTANTKSEQRVFMNNPLRYAGETFYQTQYAKDGLGREVSTLQIVKNRGWMIPYVCCMFVVIGLVGQFGTSLLGFLEKKQKQAVKGTANAAAKARPIVASKVIDADIVLAEEAGEAEGAGGAKIRSLSDVKRNFAVDVATPMAIDDLDHSEPAESPWWIRNAVTLIFVGLFALLVAKDVGKTLFGTVKHQGMNLTQLGMVPITFNGRVQPIESLAKNTLRQLTKREEVYDGQNEKQPALKWLADVMFKADGFEDYRLIRIEDPTIIDALGLTRTFDGGQSGLAEAVEYETDPKRKEELEAQLKLETGRPSLRYTLAELNDAPFKIREMLPEGLEPEDYTQFQSRLVDVSRKIAKVQAIQIAFGALLVQDEEIDLQRRINLALSSNRVGFPLLIPMSVGKDSPDEDGPTWETFARAMDRQWIEDLAQEYGATDYMDLADAAVDDEIMGEMRETLMARQAANSILRNDEMFEMAKKTSGIENGEQLQSLMAENWGSLSPELKAAFETNIGPIVDAIIEEQKPRLVASLAEQFEKIGGLDEGSAEDGDAKTNGADEKNVRSRIRSDICKTRSGVAIR